MTPPAASHSAAGTRPEARSSTAAPPTEVAVARDGARRMGFFTDTTVCIGCKACEVACKQWNDLPADGSQFRKGGSYDHTGELSGSTWRHVRFVELLEPSPALRAEAAAAAAAGAGGGIPAIPAAGRGAAPSPAELASAGGGVTAAELPDLVAVAEDRDGGAGPVSVNEAVARMGEWVFMSDVCKHCTNAGCLDACPTGALIRTEFDTVVLQPDVCNGCGYCVPACPFGVVDRDPEDGRAAKCTLCYDRLQDGLEPACAKACPTDSIQFGPYDELVEVASGRVAALHRRGIGGAYLYGAGDEAERELAGGLGAFFLLTEPPERYGLPAQADSPIQQNVVPATAAAVSAGLAAAALTAAAFVRAARQAAPAGGPVRRALWRSGR
jgi:formate dehydrogenase iron-sulfur subunit